MSLLLRNITARLFDPLFYPFNPPIPFYFCSCTDCSVYFSPRKGDRLLTLGHDNRIKMWKHPSTSLECTWSLSHNNNTGRWLSNFKAVWDPKVCTRV